MDGNNTEDRLEQIQPDIEDWHALLCFLKVSLIITSLLIIYGHMFTYLLWKELYKSKSRDHGTLGHLFSLLGRLPQVNDPKDLHACLDTLMTVMKGHIIAAACMELGLEDMDGTLSRTTQLQLGGEERNRAFIVNLATKIVDSYTLVTNAFFDEPVAESGDGIHNYAHILCHFGSLMMEFTDAWAEGDGERILRCWKFFLFTLLQRR